jgi:hypothetical protein
MNFPEYDAKKPGDNFARCSTCDRLHSLRRIAIASSEGAMLWELKLTRHIYSAMAHRELYSANRYRSRFFPGECVTIIHDKMDHTKTASPVFSHKTKQLDGLMKLPVAVTGMLAMLITALIFLRTMRTTLLVHLQSFFAIWRGPPSHHRAAYLMALGQIHCLKQF